MDRNYITLMEVPNSLQSHDILNTKNIQGSLGEILVHSGRTNHVSLLTKFGTLVAVGLNFFSQESLRSFGPRMLSLPFRPSYMYFSVRKLISFHLYVSRRKGGEPFVEIANKKYACGAFFPCFLDFI